jgi:hypothetical protein
MRKIKSYKLFESFKSDNSNYETLKDVLQSELFDELDIETISNPVHSFDEFGGEPRHKFWSYFIIPSDLAPSSLSAPIANALYTCDSNISGRIAYINVFNILDDERDQVDEILIGLIGVIRDMMGCDLRWDSEEFVDFEDDDSSFSAFDYTIKLVQI